MMSVLEYANDVNKSVAEILKKCEEFDIPVNSEDDLLREDDIVILDNANYDDMDEIVEARTFGFYRDLKKFQLLGFARGVNIDNTLGLMDDGTYSSALRSDKEPIKHKILDLFGDFYLTGVSILDMKAQILVKEAGHTVHIKVAKELKNKLIKI